MKLALVVLTLGILACGEYTSPNVLPTPTVAPHSGKEGYSSPAPETAQISPGSWNCRQLPNGAVVAYATEGQTVEILDRADGWLLVELAGRECWIREEAIE